MPGYLKDRDLGPRVCEPLHPKWVPPKKYITCSQQTPRLSTFPMSANAERWHMGQSLYIKVGVGTSPHF